MLFTYNKNSNLPIIKIGKKLIDETSVSKFLGKYLEKKLNFVNPITEIAIKVAKSIGLLYKQNRFFPETILKKLYTSLIHPYLLYGIVAWHLTYQNYTSKIYVLLKKVKRPISATNRPTYTSNIIKSLNFQISIIFKCRNILFSYCTPIVLKK